jgi:chromosome partitioning protein
MKVIAITNQKGGTAKTTSVLGIGSALIRKGKKVLFIDLDPQSNLTRGLGMRHVFLTSADFMMGKDRCLFRSKEGNNSLIPASDSLYTKESELMSHSALPQNLLKKALVKVKDRFDYALIDCPPALGLFYRQCTDRSRCFLHTHAGRFSFFFGGIEQSPSGN